MRKYVTDQLPEYAGYTVWRGLVPVAGIDGPPSGSATIRGVQYATLGFPCAGPSGTGDLYWNCGIYMLMPEADVEAPSRNRQVKSGMKSAPEWFVPFVHHLFGARNAKFWQQCSQQGKVSPHPVWELAADRVVAGRIVILGDAAHMASPRTGAGAYTAVMLWCWEKLYQMKKHSLAHCASITAILCSAVNSCISVAVRQQCSSHL